MSGTKGVAMSAGSKKTDEIYVGFLFILLSFLYLSHLTEQMRSEEKATHAQTKQEELKNG